MGWVEDEKQTNTVNEKLVGERRGGTEKDRMLITSFDPQPTTVFVVVSSGYE